MHHAVREDRHVLEVGPEVEFSPLPICLIVIVQQPSSSSPSSWLRRWFEGVMRICRASLIFSSLILGRRNRSGRPGNCRTNIFGVSYYYSFLLVHTLIYNIHTVHC